MTLISENMFNFYKQRECCLWFKMENKMNGRYVQSRCVSYFDILFNNTIQTWKSFKKMLRAKETIKFRHAEFLRQNEFLMYVLNFCGISQITHKKFIANYTRILVYEFWRAIINGTHSNNWKFEEISQSWAFICS